MRRPSTKHVGEQLDPMEQLTIDGYRISIGRIAVRVFNALCENPYGLTARRLAEIVYADDPNGGPDWALNSVVVCICMLNKRWKARGAGLRIRSRGHWGYQIWIVR